MNAYQKANNCIIDKIETPKFQGGKGNNEDTTAPQFFLLSFHLFTCDNGIQFTIFSSILLMSTQGRIKERNN